VVIDPKRREMFTDLYRLAEYYENPPFIPGEIQKNAEWFVIAMNEALYPFLNKHKDQMASDLAFAVVEDANRKAVKANNMISII
jgi:hypothetical protein